MKNRLIKWITTLGITAILLIGIALPLSANDTGIGITDRSDCTLSEIKLDDPPWDPGDEQPSRIVTPEDKIAATDRGRGDDPWDPGDESGPKMGVRHG